MEDHDIDIDDRDAERASNLRGVLNKADDWLRDCGRFVAMEKISKYFGSIQQPVPFPTHLSEPYLMALAELAGLLDEDIPGALPIARDITRRYPERAHLRKAVVEVRWKVGTWNKSGAIIYGTCKPTPTAYRECWVGEGVAPQFRLTLSLPFWIIATESERRRLIHHELGHAVWKDGEKLIPGSRTHDIEEFADTIARFGLMDGNDGQALAAMAMENHPDTATHIAGVSNRQQELFRPVWSEKEVASTEAAEAAMKLRKWAEGRGMTVSVEGPETTPPPHPLRPSIS